MRGQGCTDPRIIGNDFVAAVDQVLVPDLPEKVPFAFNESVVQRVVSLIEVDPEAHSLRHLFPVGDVGHHRLTTQAREFRYPDLFLNLGLFVAVDQTFAFQVFFNLVFNRQTMSIPASFARHVVTTHCLVTRVNVFEASSQHMVNAGLAVGCWRTFVEREQGPACRLCQGRLEHIVLAPEIQHILFNSRTVITAGDFLKAH